MELKLKRQRVLAEARRDLVLQAVRAAISEGGLESASIREIAARAGYTPGALYAYFSSKQALLAAVLKETMEGANAAAAQAKLPKSGGVTALHARAKAWLAHFTARPGEVGVVLHLLAADGAGVEQAALVRQLTEDLQKSLDPIAQELELMGCPPSLLKAEVTGLLAMALGALLMRDSRRMSVFNAATLEAFTRYLDRLAAQFDAVPDSQDDASAALQTDLFG